MRVSSRTPEGEPLECRICGQRSFVLLSDPPRDSTCPNCGCFSWFPLNQTDPISNIPIDANAITSLVNGITRCDNSREVAVMLNSGFKDILHPDGIVIWVLEGPYANEVRLQPIAQHGECDGQSFAREILNINRVKTKRKECAEPFRFSLGLPWKGTKRAIGAIELSYARDVTEDCEKCIERVAGSLAIVAASKFCRVN